MASEVVIENHIKLFVNQKIAEDVFMELRPRCISIKHSDKKGCTVLAILWAHVLQHDCNYPQTRYAYRDGYDKAKVSTTLVLKVDDILITLFMKTGCLIIQGDYIFDWIKSNFADILNRYDEAVHMTRHDYLYHQKLQAMRSNAQIFEKSLGEGEDIVDDIELEPCYGVVSTHQVVPPIDQFTQNVTSDYPESKFMNDEDLESTKQQLLTGGIRNGPTYIYDLWKSLLNKWFSVEDTSVYIVTASIDVDRLLDIVNYVLQNKLTASVAGLYVNQRDEDMRFPEIKQELMSKFGSKQQLFIDYKIFNKLFLPVNNINCNFVCGIKNNIAEVLVTSAKFNQKHFGHDSLESVMFLRMPEQKFKENYLSTINEPSL